MPAWRLWATNPKKNRSLATKDIRVAWVMPALVRAWRWHPVFREFTKLFPNTVFFTGIWPGFTRGLEGTFKVEKLRGHRIFSLGQTELGVHKSFTWVPPSALLRLLHFRPDVLFTNGFSLCTFYALLVKALTGSPVILLWQGVAAETGGEPGTVRLWMRRMMGPFFDLAICNTREGTEYLRTLVAIPAAKLWHCIYEVGEREPLCAQESKEDVLPSVDRPAFLFVGRLMRAKGVHKLLEASRLLVERGLHRFSLVLVGDGPQKQELSRLARALGIEDRVRWGGWVPHDALGPYYQACDVFVLPSLEDNWGVVVPEAMAFGKPILCSQHAGAHEIVQHGVNGFAFDAYNPEELAGYMERFVRDPGLIEKFGAASNEIIAQHAHPRVAGVLAGVVARVLDSGPPIPVTQSASNETALPGSD